MRPAAELDPVPWRRLRGRVVRLPSSAGAGAADAAAAAAVAERIGSPRPALVVVEPPVAVLPLASSSPVLGVA